MSVLTFQPLIVIYRRVNLVYNHWGRTSIFRPLTYPFRSLRLTAFRQFAHFEFILVNVVMYLEARLVRKKEVALARYFVQTRLIKFHSPRNLSGLMVLHCPLCLRLIICLFQSSDDNLKHQVGKNLGGMFLYQ